MTSAEDRILKLAERIRRFSAEGEDRTLSERDTNVLLVEELLRIAGWPTEDPSQVSREDRPTERPVDYALKIGRKPVVLVESKRLANKLTSRKHLEQALAYASSAGVRWCVLTNGSLFRIYNSLAPEVAEKKLLAQLDLVTVGQDPGLPVAKALQVIRLISPESVESGGIDQAWEERYTGTKIREVVEELWARPDPGLINLVRQRMMLRGRTLSRKDTSRWLGTLDVKIETRSGPVPVVKPKPKLRPRPPVPTQMGIGSYRDGIRHSNEVLIKTAEWLIRQGKLSSRECPMAMGPRRSLVSTEPKHPEGQDFRAPKQLSNGLWLEVNLSARDCIRNARRLLEECGYSAEMLEVE